MCCCYREHTFMYHMADVLMLCLSTCAPVQVTVIFCSSWSGTACKFNDILCVHNKTLSICLNQYWIHELQKWMLKTIFFMWSSNSLSSIQQRCIRKEQCTHIITRQILRYIVVVNIIQLQLGSIRWLYLDIYIFYWYSNT